MLNNFFIADDGRLEELAEFVQLARDHFAALLPDVCYPVEDGKNWEAMPDSDGDRPPTGRHNFYCGKN
jgi:hypothetical protein